MSFKKKKKRVKKGKTRERGGAFKADDLLPETAEATEDADFGSRYGFGYIMICHFFYKIIKTKIQ